MKQIATYIGYVMAVWGVVVTIWALATKYADRQYDVLSVKESVIELKEEVQISTEKIDTLMHQYSRIKEIQNSQVSVMQEIVRNQNILKSSFVRHLEMDDRYEELVKFLQGYQFDLQKAMSDSVQFNILINRIKR